MTHTHCMTSHCALSEHCTCYEDDAGKHLLTRKQDNITTCPFFIDRNSAGQTAH